MQCKLCGARLEPDMELCPECGMRITREEQPVQEEPQEQQVPEGTASPEITQSSVLPETESEQPAPKKNSRAWKIAAAVAMAAVAALLCVLLFVVFRDALFTDKDPQGSDPTVPTGTVPPDGNPNDVTCQGSYTDTEEVLKGNADTVIATMGDMSLTNGQLQVLYSMIQYSYIGNSTTGSLEAVKLNLNMPLDQQRCGLDETLTWQQYFLKAALEEWKLYAALCQAADDAKFELPENTKKELDGMYDQFYKTYVESGKFATVDAMLQHDMGPGCTFQDYDAYRRMNAKAMAYYNELYQKLEVSEEAIDAYFKEFEETLSGYGIKKDGSSVVDVRHILVLIETAAGGKKTEYTEAEWEACRDAAQKILDQWLAGDATEESFGQLAGKHSEDPGSKMNGGLYTNVFQGDMVKAFDEWCFDKTRKVGDYGLVKTEYGYHIMYFSGSEEVWHRYCREEAAAKQLGEYITGLTESAKVQVSYDKIGLWSGESAS